MQDKRNFQGGLNRDDDPRILPNGDYYYSQNIRILSSEDNSTMLAENIRGTEEVPFTETVEFRSGTLGEPNDFKVIGSYEDKPKDCIYYFVWSQRYYHMILEYNANTDAISTVFRDTGHSFNNVLLFERTTLITGINKIGDLLYWTSDNEFLSDSGETVHNEPKYINVEKAKAGWTVYYDGGAYTTNPTSTGEGSSFTYDINTMYPFEFYTSSNDANNDDVAAWRKRRYIDVCKTRPHAPIYFYQTPVKNVSASQVNLASVGATSPPDVNGETTALSGTLESGEIMYTDIGLDSLNSIDSLDFAYKKNNLYGFVWQFAYRYVYKDNEVGSYTEWSYVMPAPQYGTNKVDEEKQNLYNEIRVWYHNGPADVKKIEIVARKCSYIETSPDEGNKGEYYLIATIDNYYYDSSYDPDVANETALEVPQYGWSAVSILNRPYIEEMASDGTSVNRNRRPSGFINFRNDGVYSQVDPVAFDKLYDQVPKRAKSQEIIGENRLAYGNYIDGFDQVKPHFHLSPQYGADSDPELTQAIDPGEWYRMGGGGFPSNFIEEYDLNESNFGEEPEKIVGEAYWNSGYSVIDYPYQNSAGFPINYTMGASNGADLNSYWGVRKAMCVDAELYRFVYKFTFPTQSQIGQKFRIRIAQQYKHTNRWGDDGYDVEFPRKGWSNWDPYDYDAFGVQLYLEKTNFGGGVSGVIDSMISDINKMCTYGQTLEDTQGTPETNPNYGGEITHHYRTSTGETTSIWNDGFSSDVDESDAIHSFHDGNPIPNDQSYPQAAAEMRLTSCFKEGDNNNVLVVIFTPHGQLTNGGNEDPSGRPDGDCTSHYPVHNYNLKDGTETTNVHTWRKSSGGSHRDSTECGGCGSYNDPGDNECGCTDDNVRCGYHWGDQKSADGSGMGYWCDARLTFNPDLEVPETSWSETAGTNQTPSLSIKQAAEAAAFKSGAWHRFGLVYFDSKGRSSTTMLNTEDHSDALYDRNSSVYVAFPSEKKYKQQLADATFTSAIATNNPDGITNTLLTDTQKLDPATIAWKIFHKPPRWARYYHWVYARNSSVGKFMQFTIDAAYVNKGAKVGTGSGDGQADTKIYISLNSMDGRIWSYSEKNRALIGDWSFAEGDRIRLITTNQFTTQPKYYDFKISEVGHYPGRFDFDTSPDGADGADVDGISSRTKLSSDSPVGGEENEPASAVLGKFIIIDDPKISGYSVDDEQESKIPGWAGVRVELYRPKKNTNDGESLYYEFSERQDIYDAGTDNRRHAGGVEGSDQGSLYDANDKTLLEPATGVFKRGDIWYKPRETSTVDDGGNSNTLGVFFVESYFLNDFMQTNHNNIGRPHISSPYAQEQRRKATVTYSDVYQPDTQYNGFHSFNFSQRPYMDYDLTLGSIQKLVSRETNLVMMQEEKCSTLMIGKNIINSATGDAGITLSTDVLPENAVPLAGDYGVCFNPESVAVHERTIYFIDIRRGVACRIGGDGITVISNYKMIDFFRDKMDLYTTILETQYESILGGGLYILGGYDRRHGEYVVTFPNVYSLVVGTADESLAFFETANLNFETDSRREDGSTNWLMNNEIVRDNTRNSVYDEDVSVQTRDGGRSVSIANKAETIAFNEKANRWSSFYTYYPDYFATLNRMFLSFKHGVLYIHDRDSENHCIFYDNPYPDECILQFPFNQDVSSVKTWNAISIEGADKQEVIPIISTATNGADSFVVATSGSANIEGTNVNFQSNDIAVGDSLWYNDNGTLRTLGVVTAITDADTIVTSVGEVNAFIAASSTSTGASLFNVFVITADTTMYRTKFETNINDTQIVHRTSYNNNAAANISGPWVTREEVASAHIPFGSQSTSAGGEYFGLGSCSTNSSNTLLYGNTVFGGSGTSTNTEFTSPTFAAGDVVYYDNNGTETVIGTIDSITSDVILVLSGNASTSLNNTFMYVRKNSTIEGDRLKGHYMMTKLTKRTKDKVHLYAANANTNTSELTNK